MPSIHHETLNTTFTGIDHPKVPGIHQYRGIKYASVPKRFRRATLFTQYGRNVDATEHGPIAPQVKARAIEENLFGLKEEDFVRPTNEHMDEFECLSLGITLPSNVKPNDRLPVMVWFHGGGNTGGSGSSWLYDCGPLVKRSVATGKPIVAVTVNYRLGIFGFGASPELENDNQDVRDSGVGNYGLYDQQLALEWVHYFISAFGGDPKNVTIFGESAGGWDVHAHTLSAFTASRRLFKRSIVQSGALNSALPDAKEQSRQLDRIRSRTKASSLEQLREVPQDKLVDALQGGAVRITDDGNFLRKGWKTMEFPDGPLEIMIGDCEFESAIWVQTISKWTTAKAVPFCKSLFPSSHAAAVMNAYGLHENASDKETQTAIHNLVNDIWFAYLTEIAVKGAKKGGATVYRYLFDQRSPYTGKAHHAIDLMYLFANAPFKDVRGDYNIRDSIQDKWISFANGEKPWDQNKLWAFGPDGYAGEVPIKELDERRRTKCWKAFENIDMADLQKAGLLLAAGPGIIKSKM